MLHLHLLKGYGVLHLLWGYRQREIILSFLSILKILSFPNFPINPINPTIHQKTLTEKICKGFDIIILTFSVSYPSLKKMKILKY